MSNTKQRIISATVLVIIFISALIIGQNGLTALLLLSGVVLIDELSIKMFKGKRLSFHYFFSLISFLLGYFFLNYYSDNTLLYDYFIFMAVAANCCLLLYLFKGRIESSVMVLWFKKCSFLVGFFFLLPISAMSYLVEQAQWLHLIVLMLLINFTVDTGAWFVGKNFGNKKLWPKISPKKTIAGAVGGTVISVVISTGYIYFIFGKYSYLIAISLIFLAFMAQFGDLIESKLKRQLDVKDSSNLIPGHGGIYDRLDSLIFVAPFYVMMVKYLF
ncbi:MAG: hypothetical protein CME66_03785 [Halobacteriovoraceae bacterium]|nr:hypothetical protein [Halobacteriovoraceae bacterium]